jgi:hypothetical protein
VRPKPNVSQPSEGDVDDRAVGDDDHVSR